MGMFMKIGDLKGESVDNVHKGEIDVLAWSWGLSQSGTTHTGGAGGVGKVNVQDLSFTKYVDKSSPSLVLACCMGRHYADATLTVRKNGAEPFEYLTITMEDVLVTSLSTGGSGGEDRISENVTLNFAKFNLSYQPQSEDGSKDGPAIEAKWDIRANVQG